MICIRCVGGLGNRLFIYAFARALQLDGKGSIKMYHTWQDEVEYYTQALKEMIPEGTDITHTMVDKGEELWDIAPAQMFLFRVSRRLWQNMHPNGELKDMEKALQPLWNRLGLCMITDGYIPLKKRSWFPKYVCMGYFQSRKFWGEHSEEIRQELYRPELVSKESQAYLEQIRSTNSVCLHIRLGDYVNDPAVRKVHYVCDEAYYLKAVEDAMEKITAPTFFAFTNERSLAEKIPFPKDANIVWLPSGEAVNDLQLMAQCKHFIIANSSYSWWAQFLGADSEKLVFAPEQWFRDAQKPIDLYEDNWIRIPITSIEN